MNWHGNFLTCFFCGASTHRFRGLFAALVLALIASSQAAAAPPNTANADRLDPEPTWQELTAPQREVLAPLAERWDSFSSVRKRKWIGIVNRYPDMTPREQLNVTRNMDHWSKLTQAQRENARSHYRMLRSLSPQEQRLLEEKWREYQALPEEEKEAMRRASRTAGSRPEGDPASLPVRVPKLIAVAPSASE